jgi:hypothetical protein
LMGIATILISGSIVKDLEIEISDHH